MEKLGWRDRRISPDSGSLFQTFLSTHSPSTAPFRGMPDSCRTSAVQIRFATVAGQNY